MENYNLLVKELMKKLSIDENIKILKFMSD